MPGNVWEWVGDGYDDSYYLNGPRADPKGANSGEIHVHRGGSWLTNAFACRLSCRLHGDPEYRFNYPVYRYNSYGFRLVLLP